MKNIIENIKKISILPSDTIRTALKKITETSNKCLIVTNINSKFLGTLSDGDVRRAILKNKKITSKINSLYNKNSFFLKNEVISKTNLKEIFLKKKIDLIPVINNENIVINIINLRDILEDTKSQKKVDDLLPVIMAGGKGTRLQPFTSILPKPLLPINGKTVIEHILDNLKSLGLNNFIISVYEKSEIIKSYFQELNRDYKLTFLKEKIPLGTIGSLSLIKKKNIKENILIINCDVMFKMDLESFYNFHKQNKYDITIVVSDKNFEIPYGVCSISKKGNLKKINEKPKYDLLVNIGLYIINKKIIGLIPKNKHMDFNELLNKSLKKRLKIGVFPISEKGWFDTGQWSELNKLNFFK